MIGSPLVARIRRPRLRRITGAAGAPAVTTNGYGNASTIEREGQGSLLGSRYLLRIAGDVLAGDGRAVEPTTGARVFPMSVYQQPSNAALRKSAAADFRHSARDFESRDARAKLEI